MILHALISVGGSLVVSKGLATLGAKGLLPRKFYLTRTLDAIRNRDYENAMGELMRLHSGGRQQNAPDFCAVADLLRMRLDMTITELHRQKSAVNAVVLDLHTRVMAIRSEAKAGQRFSIYLLASGRAAFSMVIFSAVLGVLFGEFVAEGFLLWGLRWLVLPGLTGGLAFAESKRVRKIVRAIYLRRAAAEHRQRKLLAELNDRTTVAESLQSRIDFLKQLADKCNTLTRPFHDRGAECEVAAHRVVGGG